MQSDLANLAHLFARMEAGGFDTASPLKWCFYFTDADREKLRLLYQQLRSDYLLEELNQPEGTAQWTLFVSKSGTFTAEALHDQNLAFNALAANCGVESYEGWRVEKTTLF